MPLSLSNSINFFRWFSAFIVVISHSRRLFFEDYSVISSDYITVKIFYFLTGFGHQAVIIFFVLSGFLVAGNFYRKGSISRSSLISYSIDRFSRIYPPLIFALILTFFISYTIDITDKNFIFNLGHSEKLQNTSYDFITFLGNIFALQTIYVSEYGLNLPLWSLAYEVWYYIWLPFIYILFKSNKGIVHKNVIIIFILFLMFFVGIKVSLYFFIWLLGSSLAYIKISHNRFTISCALIIFLMTLFISRFKFFEFNIFFYDITVAISFVFLLSATAKINALGNFFNRFNKKMADFSYTLYLIHYPIVIFIGFIFNNYFNYSLYLEPNFLNFCFFLLLVIFSTLISFFAGNYVEGKTHIIRNYLYKKLVNT